MLVGRRCGSGRPCSGSICGLLWSCKLISTTGRGMTVLRLLSSDVAACSPVRGTPSLMNVIRGDLSLVGPRPRLWEPGRSATAPISLTPIAPGLTGPWRLVGPDTAPQEQNLADLTCGRNYSIWEDFRILWRTALCLLRAGLSLGPGRWCSSTALKSDSDAPLVPAAGIIASVDVRHSTVEESRVWYDRDGLVLSGSVNRRVRPSWRWRHAVRSLRHGDTRRQRLSMPHSLPPWRSDYHPPRCPGILVWFS
jgi:hypothetical protein